MKEGLWEAGAKVNREDERGEDGDVLGEEGTVE